MLKLAGTADSAPTAPAHTATTEYVPGAVGAGMDTTAAPAASTLACVLLTVSPAGPTSPNTTSEAGAPSSNVHSATLTATEPPTKDTPTRAGANPNTDPVLVAKLRDWSASEQVAVHDTAPGGKSNGTTNVADHDVPETGNLS